MQEDYRPQIEEMAFLQDVEQNDGRLMLFQLPALLPLAQQVGCSDEYKVDGLQLRRKVCSCEVLTPRAMVDASSQC